jgi:Fe-S cluster assembly protein SufB
VIRDGETRDLLGPPVPAWSGELSPLDLADLRYFVRPITGKRHAWDAVPASIRKTYTRLGVVEAEQTFCAGLQAQYDSEAVYGHARRELDRQGILFTDTDAAVREHGDLVRRYFGTVVRPTDNVFAALNSAVWSGGTFLYLPRGSRVTLPLHGFFHVQAERMGQFEHTVIVLEEGAELDYVEACAAPTYQTRSLHAGVVEIVLGPAARCRFTAIQNWAPHIDNVTNLRALVRAGALIEWIGGNLGAHITMSYPFVSLMETGARAQIVSLSVAGPGQHQDTGTTVAHLAPDTRSRVLSKSIARRGGRTTFRGRVHVAPGSRRAKSHIVCDSLILDASSRCDTYPHVRVEERECSVGHEASVSRIQDEQLFYVMSRGLGEEEAGEMIVAGFAEPLAKELPLCYAQQLNRLLRLRMSGSVG